MNRRILSVVCLTLLCSWTASARAGGGPENLFLVVNASSPDSVAVANAYAALRGIPPINVLMLPWQGSTESISIAAFRSDLLDPVLQAIDGRRLAPQISCVVYSSDFPWRIDFAEEMPEALAAQQMYKYPSGSLTGMTMLYGAVRSGKGPVWLDPQSNRYYRPLDAEGVPKSTDGFRGWHRYDARGEVVEDAGNRYLLSVMLGVTAGRGNSVTEIVRGLEASAAADGTMPSGTIYFVTNDDVRTKTRSPAFPPVVRALEALGVHAEIVSGVLPSAKRDVAGLMMGTPDFDWPASKSTIVPGAICENLTSLGGIFTPTASQTPLSVFIRAGAAGSSGTVIEPYALQAKFPHPAIHVHYARGATLAEAFYQSLQAPYQLLVVGDPLCRPWATIPQVKVVTAGDGDGLAANDVLSGRIELLPQATVAERKPPRESVTEAAGIDRFTLFIDGVQLAQCRPGERLPFDTAQLADGHHELRVVATESSSVQSQGRWVMPVRFANHGRSLSLAVEPARVSVAGAVRVRVAGKGLDGVAVFSMGRVLGRTSGTDTTIEVPAEVLGLGRVTIRATGRSGQGATNSVNADPVTIEVTEK
jgi:uncharacterized protein (TIGR03790 family)